MTLTVTVNYDDQPEEIMFNFIDALRKLGLTVSESSEDATMLVTISIPETPDQ